MTREADARLCSRCHQRPARHYHCYCLACNRITRKKYYQHGRSGLLEKRRIKYRTDAVTRSKILERNRKRHFELRDLIFAAYGNRCECCGEREKLFLTLDHVYNDGKQDRSENSGREIFARVIREGYPASFQLLCRNCNWGKYIVGVCPHVIQRRSGSSLQPKGARARKKPKKVTKQGKK